MASRLEWYALNQMNFDALNDYVEDWKSTNKKIKSQTEDIEETVIPGIKKAFSLDGTDYSAGGDAAREQAKKLTDEMGDAHTEGKAVQKIVSDAIEELKPLQKAFASKIDEIEETRGPLAPTGRSPSSLPRSRAGSASSTSPKAAIPAESNALRGTPGLRALITVLPKTGVCSETPTRHGKGVRS